MLNIIVAPSEYNLKAEKITKRIVKYLKNQQVEYSVYFCLNFDQLNANVKQLVSFGEYDFVVIGDDAVIGAVISSVKDLSKLKLGVVPTSNKDDFSSYIGISPNPIQAIKNILANKISNIDIMVANGMPVLNNIVIGASVEIFHQYSQYKFKNFISEKFASAIYVSNFQGIELLIENKSKIKKDNIFELIVANGGNCKGKHVSPLSNVQDGLFNLIYSVTSHKPGKKKYIKMVNRSEHIYDENTKQYWLDSLKITNPDKKIKVLIDGKIHTVEQLNISIIEGGLKFYKQT